jgi:acetylornithine deacetylase/succinyl-diaminopimelate desuccinylase-like protein
MCSARIHDTILQRHPALVEGVAMTANTRAAALEHFQKHAPDYLRDLKSLVRISSISFPGFDAAPVWACTDAVAALLRTHGLTDVQVLEAGTGYPSVFGQWTGAPGRPTLLLYAHYDVQPVGREHLWTTPPFEPSERDGRLYGRGASDDKGGVMMHLAAISSWLRATGSLPINIKVLIEGEEEVGSGNLELVLAGHRDLLAADAVVIADSENLDTGVPSLTASLRGIVTVTVEVRALTASVHSGTWGGPLPDPVLALAKMLATLVDGQGRPAIPGLMDRVRTLSPRDQANLDALPFNEATYRKQSRLLDSANIIGGPGTVYEKMWLRPSIAVNAIEASSRKQAANIINDVAWARVGIRIVPDMDPLETLGLLKTHLLRQALWGVQVEVKQESPSRWWRTDTDGPIFDAALAALEKGYGRKPAVTGAGGSIPFVQTITEALGGVPALLFGVGDPYAGNHSENESLVIADWESACRSIIHLFAELGGATPDR